MAINLGELPLTFTLHDKELGLGAADVVVPPHSIQTYRLPPLPGASDASMAAPGPAPAASAPGSSSAVTSPETSPLAPLATLLAQRAAASAASPPTEPSTEAALGTQRGYGLAAALAVAAAGVFLLIRALQHRPARVRVPAEAGEERAYEEFVVG